ncbi:RHTO0S11e02212g1_1 [Rhodotorula toruloides]|uniref:RHTO0S11e02212g1_1 n=2 Tax=Rhodotorula toruloides TaxID=5286 RepID=A0A061B6P4_RHOTO|nr:pleckstrin-like domain-containing protein [Rhodotorula toruloides NP11]EMS20056.1 pleckstrin-like domain-containing protein [Rhodotorula toruloides NP11]CDR45582.1 RHTO0S11e02212g1_1 [Rhodotorula toruloides]
MSETQPIPRQMGPPTPQEIERKLGSPSLPPPSSSVVSVTGSLDRQGLERRESGSGAPRRAHGSMSSGVSSNDEGTDEDGHPSPLHRPTNLPLSAISEAEDAIGSGSDGEESDASSIGGNERNPAFAGVGGGEVASRTSRDSAGLSDNVALKAGYLMKRGERRKTWKKRWFVLRGRQVAMYKNDKEYRLLRLIPLTDIHTVTPVEMKKHAHTFGIVTPRRTFYIKADSDADVNAWCRVIERAKAEYLARATVTTLETPNSTEQPTPTNGPTPSQTPRQMSFSAIGPPTPDAAQPASHPQAIAIPGSSAPSVGGSFAPVSYTTTSSSFGGSNLLGTSYASTTSSLGPAAPPSSGSRAPPNSLITPGPMTTAAPGGLGLHSPSAGDFELQGLDARLEQMDLAPPPPLGAPRPSPQRSMSGRSDTLAVPSAAMHGIGRGRSGSSATGGSSSLASGVAGSGMAAMSSSEEEDGFDPGYDYPTFSPPTAPPVPDSSLVQQQPQVSSQPQQVSSPPAQQPSANPANPNKVILSGYLMKQGKRKTWRKRWFVLTSGMLMYSRSHMDNKFNRQIPLTAILDAIEYEPPQPASNAHKRASVVSASSPNPSSPSLVSPVVEGGKTLAHTFKIITPKRTYLVCAPSEEDEIKWLAALQCLVARRTQAQVGSDVPATPSAQAPATSPVPPAAPKRTPSHPGPPPVAGRPIHGRQRSVTDAAKQAVMDVERRFHPAKEGAEQVVGA